MTREHYFTDSFEFEYGGSFYLAEVEGVIYPDEHRDWIIHNELTKILITDDSEEVVEKSHPLYDELREQVLNQSYTDNKE